MRTSMQNVEVQQLNLECYIGALASCRYPPVTITDYKTMVLYKHKDVIDRLMRCTLLMDKKH
jgi:hypothetical protein